LSGQRLIATGVHISATGVDPNEVDIANLRQVGQVTMEIRDYAACPDCPGEAIGRRTTTSGPGRPGADRRDRLQPHTARQQSLNGLQH
jgi:hypothetical protein